MSTPPSASKTSPVGSRVRQRSLPSSTSKALNAMSAAYAVSPSTAIA